MGENQSHKGKLNSKPGLKNSYLSFEGSEWEDLQATYEHFAGNTNTFSLLQMQQLFENDTNFAENLFTWMLSVTQNSGTVLKLTDLGKAAEYLLKSPSSYALPLANESPRKDALTLFLLIETRPKNFFEASENLSEIELSKDQVLNVCESILRFFLPKEDKPFMASHSLSNFIDEEREAQKQETTTLETVIDILQRELYYINRTIELYLEGKFYERKSAIELPKLRTDHISSSSAEFQPVLTPDLFSLLYLNGVARGAGKEGTLLYSSLISGTSFNRLTYALMGYSAPTVLIIKHESTDSLTQEKLINYFGAYQEKEWTDKRGYEGSANNFMFRLFPNFELHLSASDRENEEDNEQGQEKGTQAPAEPGYSYLNSSETPSFKVGLGFGGNANQQRFRIWIDDDLENKSYCLPEGGPYATGFLLDPAVQKLSIHACEVWGFGGGEALNAESEYRANVLKEKERMRKVDKKQFVNEIAMVSNTFKHKEESNEDIDELRKEANM